MKVVYYAFDGKDFDDEDECQEYELKLMRQNLGVKMFNEEGNSIDDYTAAIFINIPDQEAYNKLADYAEQLGTACPPKEGSWEWNEAGRFCRGEWVEVDSHINKLKSELEKLESIKRKCAEK